MSVKASKFKTSKNLQDLDPQEEEGNSKSSYGDMSSKNLSHFNMSLD